MAKAETPYIHLHQRKRTWTPVEVSAGKLLEGGEDVLHRALSLRALEIPVGSFIAAAMKRDLPDVKGCKELLQSNFEDEDKHDLALNLVAKVHKVPNHIEKEAQNITKAWLELDRHPILKAVVIERSIFFVVLPIFRFLGDPGLRTTSADISRDETTHVASGTLVCEDLGLKADPAMDKMRRATVAWATQSLAGEHENRYLSSNFWLSQSDSLYHTGKAKGLVETRASRQPAFFEINNCDLPQYA